MATTGRKQVAPGGVIQSAEWGNPLWDHSVQCFNSAADRANQFPTPQRGAVTWLDDVARLEWWNGTAWTALQESYASGATAWVGANAPAGALRRRFSGWAFATVNSFGAITIAVPAGFQGITFVAMHPGDEAGSLGIVQLLVGSSTLTQIGAYCFSPNGTKLNNGTVVRIMYLVEGW